MTFFLGGGSALGGGFHNFEALEVGEGRVGAGARTLLLVLHLPLGVDKSESVVSNASGSHEAVLGVVVFVERILDCISTRSGYVELTDSEAIISLLDGELRLVSCARVHNVGADDVGVLVVARSGKLTGLI